MEGERGVEAKSCPKYRKAADGSIQYMEGWMSKGNGIGKKGVAGAK